ncbi:MULTISPECIES: helix-turn-helix transcriptional regulator [Nostocaceae]|uniref:helix-turn-helix domain-containing protein n=1 Tax=Nostocaceae TaxID=1162 RepID=UPI0018EF723E|nr:MULTISPECIES: helix-turn-helix transcriptional regulator [Nostocaceae]
MRSNPDSTKTKVGKIDKVCIYCGSSNRLLLDHFIPKSITKSDRFTVTACHTCNFSKRNQHPKLWYFRHFSVKSEWEFILATVGLTESEIEAWMTPPLEQCCLKTKLPELMKSRGLDQKTLAAETGLSPTTVGKLYRSHFDRIDNHTVTTLCKYFGLRKLDDLIEIIWEEDDMEGRQV